MYALNFTPLKVEKNRKRKVCASYNLDLYKILAKTVLFTRNKIMEMHFRPIHILQYKVAPSRAAEVSRPLTFAETKRQKHLRGSCFYLGLSLCVNKLVALNRKRKLVSCLPAAAFNFGNCAHTHSCRGAAIPLISAHTRHVCS